MAIEYFRMFIDSGFFGIWGTSTLILADPMFDNIRDNEEFKTLLKKGQDQLARKRERIRELDEKGLF
jgi:hypothetical protein